MNPCTSRDGRFPLLATWGEGEELPYDQDGEREKTVSNETKSSEVAACQMQTKPHFLRSRLCDVTPGYGPRLSFCKRISTALWQLAVTS